MRRILPYMELLLVDVSDEPVIGALVAGEEVGEEVGEVSEVTLLEVAELLVGAEEVGSEELGWSDEVGAAELDVGEVEDGVALDDGTSEDVDVADVDDSELLVDVSVSFEGAGMALAVTTLNEMNIPLRWRESCHSPRLRHHHRRRVQRR